MRLMRVKGQSMVPRLMPGDFVVIAKWLPIRKGSLIIFKKPGYGKMIKEVISKDVGYEVRGSHQNSVDSRTFGPVSKQEIIGRVLFSIGKGKS